MRSNVDTLLSSVIVDGLPDEAQFWKLVITLMMRAARNAHHGVPAIAAFGDGAQTLWKNGTPAAAMLLERLWNDASKTLNIDLLCGYTLQGLEVAEAHTGRAVKPFAGGATASRFSSAADRRPIRRLVRAGGS